VWQREGIYYSATDVHTHRWWWAHLEDRLRRKSGLGLGSFLSRPDQGMPSVKAIREGCGGLPVRASSADFCSSWGGCYFLRYRPENSTAVTGGPRGHGQSRETTQERRKKEANKAARANHNRRTMADRKRSKGMIPS
jgi:hypothetical protein